uniref:NAD(P)-bd_dom domain-containing protein n=1 Tax=Meloidogyne hapla TaxID=6305 RepID=A0A1I8BRC0_MELHA
MRNATIVVVGDIGHSPRTCNHAYSLASHGLRTNIIGYLNSKPHPKIINHENISWTPDEDFSILLDALNNYDEYSQTELPKLLVVITGKGPQKEFYLEKISVIPWQNVFILTEWLEAEDYPKVV